jgi:5'-nucleotidase (lipoprotein e(P4) family)
MRLDTRWVALFSMLAAVALIGAGCACTKTVSEPATAAGAAPGTAVETTPGTTSAPASQSGHQLLNAVLWARTAVEWEFACRQSFVLARARLDEALADSTWTAALEQTSGYTSLPPAVIVDIDETMLDNSPCEARFVLGDLNFNPKMWGIWVDEARAGEIPGAREFVQHAWDRGVRIFFVTNRNARSEAVTVENLRTVFGQAIGPDDVLCKYEQQDWTSDKSSRRAYLAGTHRIILLIGDDFGDFAYLGEVGATERTAAGERYSSNWGTKWVILPNAMYGSWEEALYGHDLSLPDSTKLERKYDALRTAE